MNSKTLNVLLILLCAAVVIAAGYFFSTVESWDKKYLSTKKNPYDTFIMHELLFSKFNSKPNRDYKSITDSSLKNSIKADSPMFASVDNYFLIQLIRQEY